MTRYGKGIVQLSGMWSRSLSYATSHTVNIKITKFWSTMCLIQLCNLSYRSCLKKKNSLQSKARVVTHYKLCCFTNGCSWHRNFPDRGPSYRIHLIRNYSRTRMDWHWKRNKTCKYMFSPSVTAKNAWMSKAWILWQSDARWLAIKKDQWPLLCTRRRVFLGKRP